MKDSIEIYVACLASYNDGILHGEWIDATADLSDMRAAIASILKTSPIPDAEEWAIHDYSGFGSLRLGEYESLERVQAIACLIADYGPLALALLDDSQGDWDYARRVLDSGSYVGPYDSLETYAREYIKDCLGSTSWLIPYIDYELLGRDLVLSGQISTVEADGQVYVLLNP